MDNKTKEILKEFEETYRDASKELSKNLRSYCLGGIGIIWMLQERLDLKTWSHNAIWSLIFFGLMFASDILQYLINSVFNQLAVKNGYKLEEADTAKRNALTKKINCYSWIGLYVTNWFFWLKIIFSILAFVFLIIHISSQL